MSLKESIQRYILIYNWSLYEQMEVGLYDYIAHYYYYYYYYIKGLKL